MDTNIIKCKLCQINDACEIKSHYISKFLRADLFDNGQSLLVNKDFTRVKVNDIPKDPYIFCKECENKLSILETSASKILENIDKKCNYNNLYEIKFENGNHLIKLNKHQTIFNLFILSQFWRASIATAKLFAKFKFPNPYENNLREILFLNLKTKKDEYLDSIDYNLGFRYIFLKPEVRNKFSRGHISAFSPLSSVHTLFLCNFYICAYLEVSKFVEDNKTYLNDNLGQCILVLSDVPRWKEFNKITLDKVFKGYES